MEKNVIRRIMNIEGMTCTGCETRIENVLNKLGGMMDVKAVYSNSNVYVTYDANELNLETMIEAVEKLDYRVINRMGSSREEQDDKEHDKGHDNKKDAENKFNVLQLIGIGVILFALYTIIQHTVGFNYIPEVDQSMSYGVLFFVGLLTSLHCIAMCGGINLSVCMQYKAGAEDNKLASLRPSALYNFGRVLSYTVIGGIFGAFGSFISFSPTAKGVVTILSGVFMVIMGLNMLGIFPWLRKLNPRLPKVFSRKVHGAAGKKGPFIVGILNGLMPCGPLQAMQLYALGTGDFATGALSMFLFSAGTVPLMFGFGAVSSILSGKFTHKMMKVSAVLVMILGVIMLNRGLSLSGFNPVYAVTGSGDSGNIAKIEDGVQVVTTKVESGSYPSIVVQKGIPVKWTLTADEENLNGCNRSIQIPEYDIQDRALVPGDNLIEFIPDKTGDFTYSCWMGMISSNIKVVEDITKVSESDTKKSGITGILNNLAGTGGCCAAGSKATRFANGKIPTDDIQVAKVSDGVQEITITVNDFGYSPAVVVVQKGVKTRIKFNTEKLNSCNNVVAFPEYQGQLDLEKQTETPLLTPEQDFTFQCWMGMLNGYVKVVDDINNVDLNQVKEEVDKFKPSRSSGGGGCCG